MKWLRRIVVGVVALVLLLLATVMIASESGEVVVLTTADGTTTRLWVVDYDGAAWLRSGNPASTWYQRLQTNAAIHVQRGADSFAATAQAEPAVQSAINALMREKYGIADQLIALLFGRDDAIPIRLIPE